MRLAICSRRTTQNIFSSKSDWVYPVDQYDKLVDRGANLICNSVCLARDPSDLDRMFGISITTKI